MTERLFFDHRRSIRLCMLCFLLGAANCADARDLHLPDRVEVPVQEYPASGPLRVVWLPSGFSSEKAEVPVATALAQLGIEVWQADVLEGRLLPPLESSLEQVPEKDIVELIEMARAGGRRVLLIASGRAGILALRGARAWQDAHPRDLSALAGAILMHPNLYLGPPQPGEDAAYHPVVAQTRVPVFILQPEQSPWRWRLDATRAELEKGGAPVFTRVLSDIRDRFYSRPDATGSEAGAAQRLANMLRDAAMLVAGAQPTNVRAAEPNTRTTAAAKGVRGLQPYQGGATPPLVLQDMNGASRPLASFRGKVVVVNFWATWCPPCVREMPSMQRLREKLSGRGFEVLAVNMGESEDEVKQFLRNRVRVTFPVLLDRNGEALKAWKVFVFPTSFVLDAEGKIRLAGFGEIEWDAPDVVSQIEALRH